MRAWLSSSTVNASTGLRTSGPGIALIGNEIVRNGAQLGDGPLAAINPKTDQLEDRRICFGRVRSPAGWSTLTCSDWTEYVNVTDRGSRGRRSAIMVRAGSLPCVHLSRLLCIEQ